MNRQLIILLFLLFGVYAISCTEHKSDIVIINPYNKVNWIASNQYKASLHMHTTLSDGHLSPNQLIDAYAELGYRILAITDHNFVSYPWTDFESFSHSPFAENLLAEGLISETEITFENRDPNQMGLVAIQANEISNHHHLGSYFSDYNSTTSNIHFSLDKISEKAGLGVLLHPIKYPFDKTWYAELYENYSSLVGIEVYNRKYDKDENLYSEDFNLWDSLLTDFMPRRNIWGFANDDFHTVEMGYAYQMFILEEFSVNAVKSAMQNGIFYYVISLDGHNSNFHPHIEYIRVDSKNASIEIIARNYQIIEWISEGQIVHSGAKISIPDHVKSGNYVRAMVYNDYRTAVAGTQAFGIIRE